MLGAQVQPLVGELRAYKLLNVASALPEETTQAAAIEEGHKRMEDSNCLLTSLYVGYN